MTTTLNEAASQLGLTLDDEPEIDLDRWVETVRRKCANSTLRFAQHLRRLPYGRSGGWELSSDLLAELELKASLEVGWGSGSVGQMIRKGLMVRNGWASTNSYRPALATTPARPSVTIYHARYDAVTGAWTTGYRPVEDVVADEQMPRLDR